MPSGIVTNQINFYLCASVAHFMNKTWSNLTETAQEFRLLAEIAAELRFVTVDLWMTELIFFSVNPILQILDYWRTAKELWSRTDEPWDSLSVCRISQLWKLGLLQPMLFGQAWNMKNAPQVLGSKSGLAAEWVPTSCQSSYDSPLQDHKQCNRPRAKLQSISHNS